MNNNFDIAIVGSGPAGITAGIYCVRGAAKTVLFTGETWGGQLMQTTLVENYPGFPSGIQGPDLMANMKLQAENLGTKLIPQNIQKISIEKKPFELVTSNEEKFYAKVIIIATGAKTTWLRVPGEEKLIGRGVSSCAPCDAPFFKNKSVVVVGGGDSAMEEALVLEKFAKKITLIHRRDEFRASKIMQQKVLNSKKIKILRNTQVQEMIGTDKLKKLILKNDKENKTFDYETDGVFVAIGHSPVTQIFEGKINLDEKGFIKKNEKSGYQMATSVDGIFVAGDVHDHHYKQAITAAGFGCMAALDALKYIS